MRNMYVVAGFLYISRTHFGLDKPITPFARFWGSLEFPKQGGHEYSVNPNENDPWGFSCPEAFGGGSLQV